MNSRLAALVQFKSNKPGKKRRRIELTYDRFDVGETPRKRMQRNDVAVTDRGQGHEAKIDQVSGNSAVVVKRRETAECVRLAQRDKTIKRYED